MSYLVLARKYRPQTFADIVGQEHVTTTLANAFERGRVHHAFLFCGARGVGKTTAARVLAKAMCCENADGKGGVCNTCTACTTIADGTAVDYYEIDGASNNGIDDVRELRDGVRYQPAQLKRKIYVIDEVHMLSVAAFNGLLKTLEEPPPHVTFIFATTEVHKIPVTILSRCQRYDFKLVPQAKLVAHLGSILQKEQLEVEPGALGLLAREAGGSVRDALSLTDQVIAYTGGEKITAARVAEVLGVADRGLLTSLLAAVLAGDVKTALGQVAAAQDRGVDLAHLGRTFLGLLRDAIVVASVPEPEALVEGSPDEIAALQGLTRGRSRAHLSALFERLARGLVEMAESPTPRLVLEVALVDLAATEPLMDLGEISQRMAELEGRLRGGGGPAGGGGGGAPRPSTAGQAPRASAPAPRAETAAPKAEAAPEVKEEVKPEVISVAVASPPRLSVAPAPAAVPVPVKGAARVPVDPVVAWEHLIDVLGQRSITLSSVFVHARLLAWNDKGLEVGFAQNSLQASLGADNDSVARMKAFLADELGGTVEFKVTVSADLPPPSLAAPRTPGAGALSVAEREQERIKAQRAEREAEARSHPLTKAALSTFDAVIKEIKEI